MKAPQPTAPAPWLRGLVVAAALWGALAGAHAGAGPSTGGDLCNRWQAGPLVGSGTVRAAEHYGGQLVLGGEGLPGGDATRHILRLADPAAQSGEPLALGAGLDGPVYALQRFQGDLVAGGAFVGSGGNFLPHAARWDGTTWSVLGDLDGPVHALWVHGGELFAAGAFTGSSAEVASGVARWDGSAWRAVGSGIQGIGHALLSHKGELVLAGQFGLSGGPAEVNAARWSGGEWVPMAGLSGAVYALHEHNGALHAGGGFVQPGLLGAKRVARWTGSGWVGLGGGVDDDVLALASLGGELVAAGRFQLATAGMGPFFGSVLAPHVARWNGVAWRPMDVGLLGVVHGLLRQGDEVVALGSLALKAGGAPMGTARWCDFGCGLWSPFPKGFSGSSTPVVNAILDTPIGLVVGGVFTEIDGAFHRSVARFQNGQWHNLGGGLAGIVYALTWHAGELHAGGAFAVVGDPTIRNLARWDGVAWRAVGGSPNLPVFALETSGGELFAGGQFSSVGPTLTPFVARWNGSLWKPLGSGTLGSVFALRAHGGALYVGGLFSAAGGAPARNIARWQGGAWSALGSGTDGPVTALWVYGGDLAVGGSFDDAGGVEAHSVALWRLGAEGAWDPLGGGLANAASGAGVLALRHIDGKLIAGGSFGPQSGAPAAGAALWDGSGWTPLDGDVEGSVHSLEASYGSLVVGGFFARAGQVQSPGLVKWNPCLLAVAQPFGNGLPPGSLRPLLGEPRVGQEFFLGLDPAAAGADGATLALLYLSLAPDPAFPSGTWLAGFGYTAPFVQPLLLSLGPNQLGPALGPFLWHPGAPALDLPFSVPLSPQLVGAFLYAQGLFASPTQGLALSNGLVLLVGN